MSKAVVILSGGMDSTLCAYMANREYDELIAVHFSYGQRTEKKELESFRKIVSTLKIKTTYEIDLSFFETIGASSLIDISLHIRTDGVDKETPNTYVPYRNGIFISIATAILEKQKAEAIYIGVVQEDSSGYPDCTKGFIDNIGNAINTGTKKDTKVVIKTPLISISKKDIVDLSIKMNIPIELTWSCYAQSEFACGVCDSCRLRLQGFKQAKIKDKIQYKKDKK